MRYACTQTCPGNDAATCSAPSTTADANGVPKREIAFVVDGMGGTLRWRTSGAPTFAWHPAGWGAAPNDAAALLLALERLGFRTVDLVWQEGVVLQGLDPLNLGTQGWITRADASPRTLERQVARPAAILRWIHDHFGASGFGLGGCSGGAFATLGAQVFYDIGALDYQMTMGGPPFFDLNVQCGAITSSSWCARAPGRACTRDADCDDGDACMNPVFTSPAAPMNPRNVDYVYETDACVTKTPSRIFRRFDTLPTFVGTHTHPIDFVVDVDKAVSDVQLASGANEASFYDAMRGPQTWLAVPNATHCQSAEDAQLASATAARIASQLHAR